MELRPRNLLLGGAAVIGGALCGFYFYRKSKAVKETKAISRQSMLLILKEQEKESYQILKFTAHLFRAAFAEYEELNMNVPLESTQAHIFSQYPIGTKLATGVMNILNKYGISEKEFVNALDVTFIDDQDIQEMRQVSSDRLENACRGNAPAFASNFPSFLTAEKVLQVHDKILKQEDKIIIKLFEPLKKEGRSFWEDQERVSRFLASATTDLEINAEKRKVLVAEGLDGFEESPEKIYDTALRKYLMTEPGFQQKFDDLRLGRVDFMEEFQKRRPQYTS